MKYILKGEAKMFITQFLVVRAEEIEPRGT